MRRSRQITYGRKTGPGWDGLCGFYVGHLKDLACRLPEGHAGLHNDEPPIEAAALRDRVAEIIGDACCDFAEHNEAVALGPYADRILALWPDWGNGRRDEHG